MILGVKQKLWNRINIMEQNQHYGTIPIRTLVRLNVKYVLSFKFFYQFQKLK